MIYPSNATLKTVPVLNVVRKMPTYLQKETLQTSKEKLEKTENHGIMHYKSEMMSMNVVISSKITLNIKREKRNISRHTQTKSIHNQQDGTAEDTEKS